MTASPLGGVLVGGVESGEDDPMTPAEFRMVREYLGLTGEQLAAELDVSLRSLRRWEHGHSPVPDGVREAMEALEARAAGEVGRLVAALRDAPEVVLQIPDAGWWRMVAARVAQEVPGLTVRYLG